MSDEVRVVVVAVAETFARVDDHLQKPLDNAKLQIALPPVR